MFGRILLNLIYSLDDSEFSFYGYDTMNNFYGLTNISDPFNE
jgi:hypothetical protein